MSTSFTDIRVAVFDAYGTLFDVHSAAAQYSAALGDWNSLFPSFGVPSNCSTPGFEA